MAEIKEHFEVHDPQVEDPREAVRQLVEQLNVQLHRIAEELSQKQDA